MPQYTKSLASVTIPGHAITTYDVEYDYGPDFMTRTPSRRIMIEATEAVMNYSKDVAVSQQYVSSITSGRAPVKRRVIHVFKQGDKYKVVAVGFRESEHDSINAWAAGETAALVLDYDAPEVDVKYVYTGE